VNIEGDFSWFFNLLSTYCQEADAKSGKMGRETR